MTQPSEDPRVRVNLDLPKSLRDKLVQEADRQNVSMAKILHRALQEYLDRSPN